MKQIIQYLFLGIMLILSACGSRNNNKLGNNLLQNTPNLVANSVSFNPTFEKEFASLFEVKEMPYTTDTSYALQDTIPAEIVIKYILEAAESAEIDIFKDVWGDEETQEMTRQGLKDRYIDVSKNAFAVINFGLDARLSLNDNYYSFIFHYIPTFMDGRYRFSFLANYGKDGKLIDILSIGELTQFVDMENFQMAEIDKEGNIQINTKLIRYGQMYDYPEDYEESGEQTFILNESGKFILKQENYSSFSGKFLAKTSSDATAPRFLIEQMFDDTQVRYQPSADVAPQNWEVVKINANKNELVTRKPGTTQDYILSYDEAKATFVCKNSKGEKTSFARVRN